MGECKVAQTAAQKQKAYRQRQREERAVLAQAADAGVRVDPKSAARKVEAAQGGAGAAPVTAEDLWEALDVGRCCRIWEEVVGGHSLGERELAEWIESEPPLLWLFLAWIAQGPWAVEYQDWWEAWSVRLAG